MSLSPMRLIAVHQRLAGRLAAAALLAVALAPAAAGAEPAPDDVVAPPAVSEELTREAVQARLKTVDESDSLDDATKTQLRELYGEALRELEQAARRLGEAATFEQMIASEPEQNRSVKEQSAALSAEPAVAANPGADLKDLELELSAAADAMAKAKKAAAALETEPKRRANRRKEIPGLLSAAREQLAQTAQEILALDKLQEPSPLSSAKRTLSVARRQRVQQEVQALEKEIAAYDVTSELLRQKRDLAAARLLQASEAERQWREIVQRRAREQAQNEAESARLDAEDTLPALRPLAEARHALAIDSETVSQRVARISQELDQVKATLEELTRQYTRTEERVNAAGLSYAIGMLLRSQRTELPDVGYHERARRARQPAIRDTQLRLFDLEDHRSEMASLERQVEAEMDRLGDLPEDLESGDVEYIARDLLTKQRDQLDVLIRNYEKYFQTLVELDEAEQQLVDKAHKYTEFIDQRVFWIGSTAPLQLSDARLAGGALGWLVAPEHWGDVLQALAIDAVSNPVLNLSVICLLAVLLVKQRRLRAVLSGRGEVARQSTLCRIVPTMEASLTTVLIAGAWPAVLWYLGWRLAHSLSTAEFVEAAAAGLMHAAAVFFPLELVRQVCRRDGLAEAHFGWPAGGLALIRTNLKWFAPCVLPLVLVAAMFHAQGNRGLENSLGRISLGVVFLLVAVLLHRVLRPSGDFFRQVLAHGSDGWLYRLRHVWYLLGVSCPLALAALAGRGYYYTACELSTYLTQTVYVLLLLAAVGAFLLRWVMVLRRRLAIDRARQRCATAAPETEVQADTSEVAGVLPTAQPEVDLATVSQQTRRLIHAVLATVGVLCIWYIWVDALPALGILERVPIWPLSAWGDGPVVASGRADGITLADVGLTALIIVVTLIAAKNVSGLLEIAVLQHLPLDAGARYAVATISRYLILVLGVVFACGTMGIRWSTVQWLVAAVSVGLGFGLQEVFANFVCGLILLFERPIRVGDVVTVDDVTGVVSRIQIRATTVTNWDRKEFIVPNKEFVTGRLLNWTLSDPMNRVVIHVGVAYGSDTERAKELLLNAVREHDLILKEPPPSVVFEEFGESTLNFVLRCFLPNLNNRLPVIHDLHTEIHRVFKKEGIEIAFPQRDIHVRSVAQALPQSGDESTGKLPVQQVA